MAARNHTATVAVLCLRQELQGHGDVATTPAATSRWGTGPSPATALASSSQASSSGRVRVCVSTASGSRRRVAPCGLQLTPLPSTQPSHRTRGGRARRQAGSLTPRVASSPRPTRANTRMARLRRFEHATHRCGHRRRHTWCGRLLSSRVGLRYDTGCMQSSTARRRTVVMMAMTKTTAPAAAVVTVLATHTVGRAIQRLASCGQAPVVAPLEACHPRQHNSRARLTVSRYPHPPLDTP